MTTHFCQWGPKLAHHHYFPVVLKFAQDSQPTNNRTFPHRVPDCLRIRQLKINMQLIGGFNSTQYQSVWILIQI